MSAFLSPQGHSLESLLSSNMADPDPFAALDLEDEPEALTEDATRDTEETDLALLACFSRPRSAVASDGRSAAVADPHVQVVDPEVVRAESCLSVVAVEAPPRVETRGRKKGSDKHQLDLRRLLSADAAPPAAAPATRRERASAAGKASAQKRREAGGARRAHSSPASGSASASGEASLALVPVAQAAASHSGSVPLFEQERLQQALVVPIPQSEIMPTKVEKGVLAGCLRLMSKSLLADKLGCSSQTVTRRLRLLAFCIVMVRKAWSHTDLKSFDNWLYMTFPEEALRRLAFLLKVKFDEMSMRVKVSTSGGYEYAVAKLLQITVRWAALWKVGDQYVRMRFALPSDVIPIEANQVRCYRRAIGACTKFPDEAKLFESQTRMPIADQHPSNNGCDETFTRDFPEEVRHRFDCHAHVENRVADKVFDVFPNDRKGLLHTTLACNFGGALLLIKTAMKMRMGDMDWYDQPAGAGPAAAEYREKVFKVTCNPAETSAQKSRSLKTMLTFRKKRMCTGRFKRRGRYEHFCKSRDCCRDRDHSIVQCREMVDEEPGPAQWCTQRWTGFEDCCDFVLFWMLCHALFDLAFLDVFGSSIEPSARDHNMPFAAICDREVDSENEAEEDEGAFHLPENDLDLPDPVKDESLDKRQSTFRANGCAWLRSRPCGRLTVFRTTIRMQAHGQRTFIKDASLKAKKAEMRRRMKGKDPQYRVVLAAEGRYTTEFMRAWSQQLHDESEWTMLPEDFQTHELSVHAFRGISTALCTKYELQCVVLEKQCPVAGYRLLSKKSAGADVLTAAWLIKCYEKDPCILCFQWYNHCAKYPSAEKLVSADSKAEAAFRADEADIDNIDVETGNTMIHRSVRRCLQQKLVNIKDVAAQFVISTDKATHTDLYGERVYPAHVSEKGTKNKKTMRGGGGGLARAFISYHAKTVLLPNGKMDLARIWQMYRAEKALEHSPLFESLKETGRLATLSRRQQFQQGQRWSMSAFGSVNKRADKRLKTEASARAITQAIASPLPGSADAAPGLQLVPLTESGRLEGQLQLHAGSKFSDQIRLLRSLGRFNAKEANRAEEKEELELRAEIQGAMHTIQGHDLSELKSDFASVRCLTAGPHTDVYIHRDVCNFVQQRAARMVKESKDTVKSCEKLWDDSHKLITIEDSPAQDAIPETAKATYCSKFGGGKCRCKGRGLIEKLAAAGLGREICKRSPKGSKLRSLIKAGWIVINIATRWFHIGLQYWRPQRPTVLELTLLPDSVWGHRVVLPLYKGPKRDATPRTAFEVFEDVDLADPLDVHLYKLVAFNRRLPSWRPDRLLTIAPLEHSLEGDWHIRFFKGEVPELEDEREKRRKAAEKAARAKENRKKSGVEASKAPRTRRTARPSAQHEAVKATRAAANAELLPLPAPPTEGKSNEGEAAGDFNDDSSLDDLFADPERPYESHFSSDSEYDALLISLKHDADKAVKDKASGHVDLPDHDWVGLNEIDESDVDDKVDKLPMFKVSKAGDDDEASAYTPTSPAGSVHEELASEGADADDGEAADAADADEAAPRVSQSVTLPKFPATEDRGEHQPAGCICRRYNPPGKPGYWIGVLPHGMVDSHGRHSRTRSFRDGFRTADVALALVESWLHIHAEGSPASEGAADSDSSSSSSSSSSS